MHQGEKLPIAEVKEVVSRKRKLSSSMVLTGKKKRKIATHSEGGGEDVVRRVYTKEMRIEVYNETITVMRKEVETENIKRVQKENAEELGTKKREEEKKEVKQRTVLTHFPRPPAQRSLK